MRPLTIAYGNNRQAKTWTNKTITFEELKERLRVTIRTPESAEEYAKFNKAKRDTVKDHGGFVAGALKGGRRKIDTVELRSMVALDGDRNDKAFLENYESNAPYLELLSIGLINDMYAEIRNDECKYAKLATQEDFDLF